ncbi:hydroxyisourate hydrolase [Mesobaculum littorinae]|uniref:5-hydroxyisourate hydrolase n=1 Tax=Mesobaculum littorinae TaxID=2486419 RepID=A0A438AJ03_9RHOB|nr:hydroxyisourate hydrolase [Mesobaculum littorinae]RVV98587.1 hydroxyisourate hydrolase [Mesobaculum littorinae]
MAEGYLTTHVLDTAHGRPAAGLMIELFRIDADGDRHQIAQVTTNDDGRTDAPILPAEAFEMGSYELVFHAGEYLDHHGLAPDAPRFLDAVPIRFKMDTDTHYHVPLLLSAYGYSTYRGS